MKQSAYTGKGVGVALFDTGIYPHMDLVIVFMLLQIYIIQEITLR